MVQHVNVQITDRQRTREWYEKVLGARFRDRGPERNKRQLQQAQQITLLANRSAKSTRS